MANKYIRMKKKIIYSVCLILLILGAPGCQKGCQTCKIVTRTSSGVEVSSNGGSEYCGVSIDAYKLANPDVTNPVTGNTTKVECN